MMFPASEVKVIDICYSCNCMRGHCMEDDDTKPTGYKKPQRKGKKKKEKGYDALCVCITLCLA